MNIGVGFKALERRVAALEAAGGERVNGWTAAARLLGMSVPTLKKRVKSDPRFPRPSRIGTFRRRNSARPFIRPEWRRIDLLSCKQGA